MNKRHYEHTLPNIRGSLSNTYKHSGKILKCYTFVSLKKSFRICRLSGFEAMPLNGSR